MSNFFAGGTSKHQRGLDEETWPMKLALEFPLLSTALYGKSKADDEGPAFEPMTLMVFARDGRLKFSLGSKEGARTFFGVVKTPERPLEAIEKAIADEDGEWVTRRGK